MNQEKLRALSRSLQDNAKDLFELRDDLLSAGKICAHRDVQGAITKLDQAEKAIRKLFDNPADYDPKFFKPRGRPKGK